MYTDQAAWEKEILKSYFGGKVKDIEAAINYQPPNGIQESQRHIFLENQSIKDDELSISLNKGSWLESFSSRIKFLSKFVSKTRDIDIICHDKKDGKNIVYELLFEEVENRGDSNYRLERVKEWDENRIPKNRVVEIADSEIIINKIIAIAKEINKVK